MNKICLSCLVILSWLYLATGFAGRPRMETRMVSLVSDQFQQKRRDSMKAAVGWDWKRIARDAFKDDDRPIILFDGNCNLCNGGVNFAIDHDRNGVFRYVSLQSKVGQSLLIRSGRDPSDLSSIVLCLAGGKAFMESDAVLKIAQDLDGPILPIIGRLGITFPRIIRDSVYMFVSENRHLLGQPDQCRLDFDGEFDNRFIQDPEDV